MKLLVLFLLLACIFVAILRHSRKKRLLPEHKVVARSGSPTDLENFSVTVKTPDGKELELKFKAYFTVLLKEETFADDDIVVDDWLFFRPHGYYTWSDTSRVRTKFKDGFPVPNLHVLSALKHKPEEVK